MSELKVIGAHRPGRVAVGESVRAKPAGQRGFTLIELMVVVVVVAILLSVALPAYNEQVRKTRRSTATAALLEISQALERFNTVNGTYVATAPVPPATTGTNALCNRTLDFYTVSCSTLTATTFEVRAVPAGAQTGDRCGTFGYTQAGAKSLVSPATGVTVADCW